MILLNQAKKHYATKVWFETNGSTLVKIEGCEYRAPKESIIRHYGDVTSELKEGCNVLEEDSDDECFNLQLIL